MKQTAVLIAGGGPVGLTLGHELTAHGIACVVVERNPTTTRHPKMDLTNSRSMELYQRLGISKLIRDIGVPPDNRFDVAWISSPTGHELHRFGYPSQTEMWERIRTCNDGTAPAEPPVRISQIVIEPALKAALEKRPTATVRFGWTFESFVEDDQGVTCVIRETATGRSDTVRCLYLVGCDGANSTVRRLLDIELEGTRGLRPAYMIHFRSRARDVLQRWGNVWHSQSGRGTIIAQDDDQTWTLHRVMPQGVDVATIDPRIALMDYLGQEIDAEVLVANPWVAHLLVATSYGRGRVYLAGDAVHQFVPTGGYGMNTGVGDAVDLGWKLAGVLSGWGGPKLLASYEAERRPIALRNLEASSENVEVRSAIAGYFADAQPPGAESLDAPTSEAASRRMTLAKRIAAIGNHENERWGVEYGYTYDQSPVVYQDDTRPPRLDPLRYVPTTRPGARLPSLILQDGEQLYEKLGLGFTLIAFNGAEAREASETARDAGLPLRILRPPCDNARRIYEQNLVLVRPDHHVAWRGDAPPRSWCEVFARITGN